MSNANARKGSRWEAAVRDFLREVFGRFVIRPRQEGYVDIGDLHLSPFVLQAKDWKTLAAALNEGLNGAEKQAKAAGEPFGAAVVKRRNKSVGLAYTVMTLATFRDLIARLRRAEELLARHAPEVFHTEHLPEPESKNKNDTEE